MAKKKQKRQFDIMSFEGILVVGIVLAIIVQFFGSPQFQNEGHKLFQVFSNQNSYWNVITGDAIDGDRWNELHAMEYEEIKEELGVESDFCIYFEDVENEEVLSDTDGLPSLGSDAILVDGKPCPVI